MVDVTLGGLAAMLFVIIHLLGVLFGFWLKHQLFVANAPKQEAAKQEDKAPVLSDAEQAMVERKTEEALNERMRKLGLPLLSE